MYVSVIFTIALALFTFSRWQRATLAAAESNIAETPHRFCYTSTSGRRFSVAVGYCLLVLIVVGGLAYGLAQLAWGFVPASWDLHSGWRAVLIAAMVLLVGAAFQLPGLRRVVDELRQIILRHLFFPVLPTVTEEALIEQLIGQEPAPEVATDRHRVSPPELSATCRYRAEKLTAIHAKLAAMLGVKKHPLLSVWYADEWELIDNLYQSLMHQVRTCRDPALLDQLELCEYYCWHLTVRYVFSTCFTHHQRAAKFAKLGLSVRL